MPDNRNAPADDGGESQNIKASSPSVNPGAGLRLVTPDADSTPFEPTFWLRQCVDEIVADWDEHGIPVCGHVSDSVIGITTLHERVRRLACLKCADVTPLNGDTCDRCTNSGGTAAMWVETRLHRPGTRLDGVRFLVGFGLCQSCWTREVGGDE